MREDHEIYFQIKPKMEKNIGYPTVAARLVPFH